MQEGADAVTLLGIPREEHDPAAVLAGRRERDAQPGALAPQELVGHLKQDAGAVAGVRLAPARAAVQQVDEDLQRLAHDRVRATPLDVHDEADAAGVVLAARVVQTLSGRGTGLAPSVQNFSHLRHPFCEKSCTIVPAFTLLVIPKKSYGKYQPAL